MSSSASDKITCRNCQTCCTQNKEETRRKGSNKQNKDTCVDKGIKIWQFICNCSSNLLKKDILGGLASLTWV